MLLAFLSQALGLLRTSICMGPTMEMTVAGKLGNWEKDFKYCAYYIVYDGYDSELGGHRFREWGML